MDDIKLLKKVCIFGGTSLFFLILFLVLLVNESGSGDDSIIIANNFSIPFETESAFTITSNFGYRLDPFTNERKFHTGIDLAASEGTPIIASADGVVSEVGFSEKGLGNYVYIKHQTELGIIYTAYGHMLDDSIVVEEGQEIIKGTKVGEVGTTGASTGFHLHFMIMKGKVSFKQKNLIDPYYVINGLD